MYLIVHVTKEKNREYRPQWSMTLIEVDEPKGRALLAANPKRTGMKYREVTDGQSRTWVGNGISNETNLHDDRAGVTP